MLEDKDWNPAPFTELYACNDIYQIPARLRIQISLSDYVWVAFGQVLCGRYQVRDSGHVIWSRMTDHVTCA